MKKAKAFAEELEIKCLYLFFTALPNVELSRGDRNGIGIISAITLFTVIFLF